MRNLNELSNDRQVCLVPNPNSGNKLGYELPLNTEYPSLENMKKFKVIECPLHANNEGILKMENELKYFKKKFFHEIRDRRRSV